MGAMLNTSESDHGLEQVMLAQALEGAEQSLVEAVGELFLDAPAVGAVRIETVSAVEGAACVPRVTVMLRAEVAHPGALCGDEARRLFASMRIARDAAQRFELRLTQTVAHFAIPPAGESRTIINRSFPRS
jgi:hypothetical protein